MALINTEGNYIIERLSELELVPHQEGRIVFSRENETVYGSELGKWRHWGLFNLEIRERVNQIVASKKLGDICDDT